MVLTLFSEVGRDMSRWPTAAHFVSWLGLCPDNDISGGQVLWRGRRKVKNRAGQLFRLAAHSLHNDPSPLGGYLRRMRVNWALPEPPRLPRTRSQSSSTPWSRTKWNTTRRSGPSATRAASSASTPHSSARQGGAERWSSSPTKSSAIKRHPSKYLIPQGRNISSSRGHGLKFTRVAVLTEGIVNPSDVLLGPMVAAFAVGLIGNT